MYLRHWSQGNGSKNVSGSGQGPCFCVFGGEGKKQDNGREGSIKEAVCGSAMRLCHKSRIISSFPCNEFEF